MGITRRKLLEVLLIHFPSVLHLKNNNYQFFLINLINDSVSGKPQFPKSF